MPRENRTTRSRIVATYDYVDADGRLLYQVVRWGPEKGFSQRRRPRPDDTRERVKHGWVWSVDRSLLTLYRLPKVIEAVRRSKEVWVVEGEKDVHAVEATGATATCNPGGAGKWRPEYTKLLKQISDFWKPRPVVVVDRDEPGRAHAQSLAWEFRQDTLFLVRFVQAREGKDAYDHLVEHGHSLEDFEPVEIRAEPPDRRAFGGYARPRNTLSAEEVASIRERWSR